MARILLLGCGQLTSQLPNFLAEHQLIGIRRSSPDLPGIELHQCDLTSSEEVETTLKKIGQIDAVVYTATPSSRSASEYRKMYCCAPELVMMKLEALGQKPYWLHVSSTGVFRHNSGEWVHEDTPPAPETVISKILHDSESLVQPYGKGAILRLAGLYGQGRTYLLNSIKAGRQIQTTPWSYTNRIHREDAVRAIAFLLERALANKASNEVEVFHGVDHDPAPLHEVAQFLTSLHHLPDPVFFEATEGDIIGSQNKRVANRKLLEEGFTFRYPTFRHGFAARQEID